MQKKLFFGCLTIVVLLSQACSYRKMMINDVADMAGIALVRFENEYTDLALLEAAAPSLLVNLEALLANDPQNPQMLVLLSKAYFSYTYALKEIEWEEIMLGLADPSVSETRASRVKAEVGRFYARGIDYALKALSIRYPDALDHLGNVRKADAFIQEMDADDVPAMFWYGMNLSAYINLNQDSVKAVSKLHLAVSVMKRVLELDPDYYYGCANLNLMTVFASVPPMLGGDPARALQYYHRQKEQIGDTFLLLDLQYARYYLYQIQERRLFEATLDRIMKKAREDQTRYALLNEVAARRAALYLRAADRLFQGRE